ncbi:MAG: hypothetical protein ACI8X3_003467, partial [Saprospiraceae bacterium]
MKYNFVRLTPGRGWKYFVIKKQDYYKAQVQ